jgi:DDE superfamily endonuclease
MTGSIFSEWLIWFNNRMVNRKVLLLIDGFSAHQAGIGLAADEGYALTNVRIEFLPPNTTSVCQPLDQGIIRTWKAHYRQQWLRFAVAHFEQDRDPDKAMHVLQAMRWGITAWREGITNTTIANCWVKSRVLGPKYGPINKFAAIAGGWDEAVAQDEARIRETELQLGATITMLAEQDRIQSAMSTSAFLNPADEAVDDSDEEILDSIVEAYSEGDRVQETDEEPMEVVLVRQ